MRDCPVCGGTSSVVAFEKVSDYITGQAFDVGRCAGCGLGITLPPPGVEELHQFYPARYRTDRQRYTAGWRVKRRGREVERFFDPGFRGKLIDIGCGRGSFVMHMKQRGWTVCATEIDTEKLSALAQQGIDGHTPDAALNETRWVGAFDAATCWHVLEHVDQPAELLRWARSLLREDGVFDVTVPDFGSPQAGRWGRDWFHLDVPRHLHHFTRDTLCRALDNAGLTPVHWRTMAFEYDLFGDVQSALNKTLRKKNVLFESLTSGDATHVPRAKLRYASYAAAVPLMAWSLPRLLLETARRRGPTLWVTCRRK